MRRNILVIVLVSFFSVAVNMSWAQGKPDFSGKWILDATSGAGAGRGGPTTGVELTIKQDAKTLTLVRRVGDQTETEVFNLDGSETRDTVQTPAGPRERVLSTRWEGNKLTIIGMLNVDGKTLQQNREMSMEGGNLVIEQIGGPAAIKRIFKKG